MLTTPDVLAAGGLPALRLFGRPADILRATKERLFAHERDRSTRGYRRDHCSAG